MKQSPDQQHPALAPTAPLTVPGELAGYLQIGIAEDGRISVRGSRLLLDWFLRQLAAEGWEIELDDVRWCG